MTERRVALPGDRTLTIRAVTGADVDALARLYDALDDDARYRRFFSLYRPTRAFYEHMATAADRGDYGVVAIVNGPDDRETLVGEAGYTTPADGGDPELSITVAKEWRGWLGAYLLDALLAGAAERGIANLRADVLLANSPMMALVRARGFVTIGHPDWTAVSVLIGTATRPASWRGHDAKPRVLVEVPGGRWPHEASARAGGLDVLVCPGPSGDHAHCPALDGEPCPLAAEADAIIVRPPPDDARWAALLDAHAQLHPGVPVVVEHHDGDALVSLAPRLARRQAARSET